MELATALWVAGAVVVVLAVSGWVLVRRRSARQQTGAPSSTTYAYGDPYAADTYGTNPHGLSLGSMGARPEDDDPPSRLL